MAEIRIDESARSCEDHCGAVAGAEVFKLGALAADFDSSIGPDEASNRVLIAVGFNEDKVSLQPFFRRNFLDQASVKRHDRMPAYPAKFWQTLCTKKRPGAAERARTSDLLLRRQTLYPLSYGRASGPSLPMRADMDESKRRSNPPAPYGAVSLSAARTFAGFGWACFTDAMNGPQTS